jgi:hypothetical protein
VGKACAQHALVYSLALTASVLCSQACFVLTYLVYPGLRTLHVQTEEVKNDVLHTCGFGERFLAIFF